MDEAPSLASDGVAGVLPISDLNEERRDLGILRRAAKEGWDVPACDRPDIVQRMVGIVKRTSVTVGSMMGPIESEGVADAQAIRAAQVLVAMTGQNQADRHHEDKMHQDDKHLALGVAELAAKISDADFIALAKKHNRLDLLPARLREGIGGA